MALIWLIKRVLYKIFLLYIKMSENTDLTYYQKNWDVILNRARDYYENNKERLREQARNKYRNLSEEEKNKKRESGKNRYRDMSEEKKQRLKEYQKNYCETKKSQYNKYNNFNSFLIVFIILIVCDICLCIIKSIDLCYFR